MGREQVELILRRLLEESVWDSPSLDEMVDGFRNGDVSTIDRLFGHAGTEAILALPGGDRDDILHHLERLLDRIAVQAHAGEAETARLEVTVAKIRQATAEAESRRAGRTRDAAVSMMAMRPPVTGQVASSGDQSAARRPAAEIKSPEAPAPKPDDHRRKKTAPRFATLWPEFLIEKRQSHEGHKGYSPGTAGQANMTLGLFLDLIGDKPLGDYTGTDALNFRKLLLRMPSSHGKPRKSKLAEHRVSALEEIRRADARHALTVARNSALPPGDNPEPEPPRVKLKTVKKHFSTLRQYYEFLIQLGQVDKNIFAGFKYPGTKATTKKRDAWSTEDLNSLLRSDWFSADGGREDDRWITVIGMFSGMRAEEIARLRAAEDIQTIDGVPIFSIVDHPDGWTPKSEAGVRAVPVHPFLLELGFLKFVERRRAAESFRLFSSLRPQGPDRKLSGSFSRNFSRQKIKLGIGPKTVFHSFRHSVRTILTNRPPALLRDAWIDAVMGHSSDDEDSKGNRKRQSVGITVYLKEIGIQNMLTTVTAIEYPDAELGWFRTAFGSPPPEAK